MLHHVLIILCYTITLFILMLCTKQSRTSKNIMALFLLIFIFKMFILLLIYQNNLNVISHIKSYSLYDATTYYHVTLTLLDDNTSLFPTLPWYVADPGYNTILYWLGIIYTKVLKITHPDYLFFAYFNAFVVTITFFFVVVNLKKKQLPRPIIRAAIMISGFEPTTLAFGSILEREVLVGLLLFFVFLAFFESDWISFFAFSAILILFRKEFILVLPLIFAINTLYATIIHSLDKHFGLILTATLILFCIFVQLACMQSDVAKHLLFHHISEHSGSGFGSTIWKAPYGIRVIAYALLGFVSPIPLYPFADERLGGFYLFGFLVGLGSVVYLSYHIIIIKCILHLRKIAFKKDIVLQHYNLIKAYKLITRCYLSVFVLHLIFQGLVYNVRHKVQLIALLTFLTLYCLQFYKMEITKALIVFKSKAFVLSFCTIALLNIVYLFAKIIVM